MKVFSIKLYIVRIKIIYRKITDMPYTTCARENQMRESTIEKILVRAVRKSGGLAIKLVSPGWAGAPDRLILMPGGRLTFVELKAPGQTLRPLQVKRKRQLEALGFSVYCIDQISQIGGVLDEVCAP